MGRDSFSEIVKRGWWLNVLGVSLVLFHTSHNVHKFRGGEILAKGGECSLSRLNEALKGDGYLGGRCMQSSCDME